MKTLMKKSGTIICMVAICGLIAAIAEKQYGLAVVSFLVLVFGGYLVERADVVHRKNIKHIENMDGLAFENYCAQQLAKSKKYRTVQTTPPSGDFGADIVAVDLKGKKWVFQCKRYKNHLDNTPIQEVVGAMAHYGAQRAGVITNSSFTDKARQLAKENGVELIEGQEFIKLTQY